MSTPRNKFELSPRLKLGVGRGNSNKILKIGAVVCLSLAAILAINAFRLILKSGSTQAGEAAPQVLGASDTKSSAPAQPAPTILEYKVGPGDTLFNISQKYNINWATLATLNNLKSPYSLKLGQTLKIPQ